MEITYLCFVSEMTNLKSSLLVDRVGMVMFALYQVTVTIVLVNILIAMMSHSFEDVQVSSINVISQLNSESIGSQESYFSFLETKSSDFNFYCSDPCDNKS